MRKLKTILFALLLLMADSLSAQDIPTSRKDERLALPKRVDQHDIRIGISSISLTSLAALEGAWFTQADYGVAPSFRNSVANADTYLTNRYYVGTYSLSYTYHGRRWFEYGGTLSFAATVQSRKDIYTNKRVGSLNNYAVSIMPTFRFIYFYREEVQLYSSVMPGVIASTQLVAPFIDLTLFGCSFGSRLFGFVEIGTGFNGWGRVGIGYRFNKVKK